MQYGSLPGVSGPVSRLVMGSMIFSTENFALTCDLLDRFVEAGGTAVDTARVYALGSSEEAFGAWLQQRGYRGDRVVVIGKGAHHDRDTFERRVNPAAIHEDVQASLRAMQLDRMDAYLLHKDDPDAPIGPIVEALNEQAAAGRIGAFGGCWSHRRIAEANAYAEAHGLRPFTISSPNLALAVPNEPMWVGCVSLAGDPDGLAWYERTRMPVLAWSSQARGFFSGRYAPGMTEGDANAMNVIRTYYSEANWERYRRAGELAGQKGRTLSQIALAWVLHQPLEIYALIGPRTVAELDDCLGALEVELSPHELAWLNLQAEDSHVLASSG
jgi:1-deoxyxylulose-5-phosphate synthase